MCGPPAKAATHRARGLGQRRAAGHQEQRVEVALDAEPRLQRAGGPGRIDRGVERERLHAGLGGEAERSRRRRRAGSR